MPRGVCSLRAPQTGSDYHPALETTSLGQLSLLVTMDLTEMFILTKVWTVGGQIAGAKLGLKDTKQESMRET